MIAIMPSLPLFRALSSNASARLAQAGAKFGSSSIARRRSLSASSPPVATRLAAPLRGGDRRTYYRVRVTTRDGELMSRPMATQGSGSLSSIVEASGLAVVAEGTSVAAAGAQVPTLLIGPVGAD